MSSFLKEVALNIVKKYSKPERLCLIFPNHWSRSFFKNAYTNINSRASWLPAMYSMNEWVVEQSKLQVIDSLKLLFEFYGVYTKHFPEKKGNLKFEQFQYFSSVLLNDFGEIDKNRVDPNELYAYMADEDQIRKQFLDINDDELRALRNFWNIGDDSEAVITPSNFEYLWRKMPLLYKDLNSNILSKGFSYEGGVYRKIADQADKDELNHKAFDHFIFIGFFALNPCEKAILDMFERNRKAVSYWDVDSYYLDKKHHEAGRLMKIEYGRTSSCKELNSINTFEGNGKEITTIAAPQKMGQIKAIDQYLEKVPKEALCAVVIPDNSWLFPLITSLNAKKRQYRFTSALPIEGTSVFQFYNLLFEVLHSLHSAFPVFDKERLLSLLYLLQNIDDSQALSDYINKIKNNLESNIYIDSLDFSLDFFATIYSIKKKSELFIFLKDIAVKYHFKYVQTQNDPLSKEVSQQLYIQLSKLEELINTYPIDFQFSDLIKLCQSILKKGSVSLEPSFKQEVVVLNNLDTLAIDFDYVFLLGFNEGIWPPEDNKPTYLSNGIRNVFNIASFNKQDAFYSYLFFRLIQRSRHCSLFYNNVNSYGQSSEVSRYYYQLLVESDLKIDHLFLDYSLENKGTNTISIQKNTAIMQKLSAYLDDKDKKPFSSSAFSDYISCPLKFCFKRIFDLKEVDDDELSVSNIGIGNILHYTLEYIYNSELKPNMSKEGYKDVLNQIDGFIIKAFKRQFKLDEDYDFRLKNEQFIIRDVVQEFVNNVFKYDINKPLFTSKGVEVPLEVKNALEVETFQEDKHISIIGAVDRVDAYNEDSFALVDYKTGKADLKFKEIEDLFDSNIGDKKKTVFQALLYNWLYREQHELSSKVKINNEIYALKSMHSPSFNASIFKGKDKISNLDLDDWLPDFKKHLSTLVNEIFNKEIAFNQTEDSKKCKRCYFNKVCQR